MPLLVIVKYQRKQYKADLIEDGTIEYDGKTYNSCSAFALDVKRQTTPNKKADDGELISSCILQDWESNRFIKTRMEKLSLQRKKSSRLQIGFLER